MMKRSSVQKLPVPPPAEAAALPAKRWAEMTKAEKLSANADLSLDVIRKILELAVDPDNVKLLAQIKDAALTTISQQVRLDEQWMREPRRAVGTYDDMFRKLEATDASAKPIEEILREVAAEDSMK
jgi:hypothetical protein